MLRDPGPSSDCMRYVLYCCVSLELGAKLSHWGLGPVSLTFFPSHFQFDGNFVSLSSRFWCSDRYKILYMARQLCCRGMCKNLLRSDSQQRNYSKAKFPSNWNCGQKIVSETGPWGHFTGYDMASWTNVDFEGLVQDYSMLAMELLQSCT